MKGITKLFLLLVIISSCSKKNLDDINSKVENVEDNIEAANLYELYNNADYRIGILYDNNFGNKALIRSSGSFPDGLNVSMDNFDLEPNRPYGQLDFESDAFNILYGEDVDINISDVENSQTNELYSPEVMSFSSPAVQPSIAIERTGNDLEWTQDEQSFGILVRYVLYDVDRFSNEQHKVIDSGNEFISDNGLYNIDHLLNNTAVKSIEITLTRANGINFVTKDNENVFVSIQSMDAHYYVIND